MNKKQYQLEVCKAMLDHTKYIRGCDIDENTFAVTTDGFECFVFDNSEIIFDKSKIAKSDFRHILSDNKNDIELKQTREMIIQEPFTIVKFEMGSEYIYIKEKYVSQFKGYRLFAYSPLDRVLVKDDFENVIAVIMPFKIINHEP